MGMSSSQARLLHLTSRMHQIEYKAAKLEAQKLQMANDSKRAYADYLEVLEATKIQYSALTEQGILTFRDATLNAMENRIVGNWAGDTSKEILFMQDMNGKVYVTPTVAAKYGLTSTAVEDRDLDTFVRDTTGKDKTGFPVYRQEPVYREEPNMITKFRDSDQVNTFTPIRNNVTVQPSNTENHTYSPIANIEGGIDYSALDGYAKYDDSHTANTSGSQSTSSTSDWITASSGTYTVSSVADMMALNGKSIPAGVTVVLTQNIDMSGQTGWTGITTCAGTFDGNGYKISNLTGTQGLISSSTSGAVVKNVGLENININGNSSCVGGLIGSATDTTIQNCYTTGSVKNNASGTISEMYTSSHTNGTGGLVGKVHCTGGYTMDVSNVYSSATVTATSMDGVGGLIGTASVSFSNGKLDIHDSYAIGSVSGKNGVGGFVGVMYNDQDNTSDVTDIENCYSGGNVTGGSYVGGFWGSYTYWGDRGDYCEIRDCNSSGKVNGSSASTEGAFGGAIYIKDPSSYGENAYVKFIDCGFAEDTGAAGGYGNIWDYDGNDVTSYVQNSGSSDGLTSFKLAGNIPSIEADGSGDYMNNIIAALIKAGEYDPCDPNLSAADKTAMETKIKNFLRSFNDNETDNAKLWYLNESIVSYLNGVGVSEVGTKLAQDINNGTKSATSNFQTGAALEGKVVRAASTGTATYTGTHNNVKGAVTIPALSDIAEQMYYALNMAGVTTTLADVQAYFNQYSTSNADDKVSLANINEMISLGNINDIFTAMQNNTKYTSDTKYKKDDYDITVAGDQNVDVRYVQEPYQEQDGTIQVFDHWEEVLDHTEDRWDTTDPDIANAIGMYAMAQRGVIVVTEEQASSYEWMVNMASIGQAVFTTFNPERVADLATLVANDPTIINTMSDEEYELFMGIENTSVSVETCLQEIQDEKNLKKAEAEYEAKMRKIDNKDKKYDQELAALEAERNATKQAMEQLKTVAKANVDRTFKLFS